MGYSMSGIGLGALYAVSADRITRIKQGLQDLGLLPAGTQASTADVAYPLKQFATQQGLPQSMVSWNGTTLSIDNALADRFAAAVTTARAQPNRPTFSANPTGAQIVYSGQKTDPTEEEEATAPFVPPATTTPSSSPLDFLKRIPWWGWAIGVVGVGAVAMTMMKKPSAARPAMVANRGRRRRRKRMRRNRRSSLSLATTRPYRRTSRKRRKLPKLRLLVRGRGKRLYVFPKRKRAEVLRGKVSISPNGGSGEYYVQAEVSPGKWVNVHKAQYAVARRWQLKNHDKLIKKGYKSTSLMKASVEDSNAFYPHYGDNKNLVDNGRIDVQYGQDGTGKGYAEDWIVKPYDLPYYHRMYSFASFDHAKRFAESVVKTLKKHGYSARTLRFDQRIAANRRRRAA